MKNTIHLHKQEARRLIYQALTGSGTSPENAGYFTDAILDTELSGLEGHGFYWLQYYCEHLLSGKVDGQARAQVEELSPVAFRVDAKNGFAHPAIEAGIAKSVPAALKYGIAAFGVCNSYNAATLGYHTGRIAERGLVTFGFTNSVPAIAPVGGATPVIGTNPMSFAVPAEPGESAFLIDQSSSAVAWTAVKRAAEENLPIPPGWALDSNGQPTTDAATGLAGSMAPAGGYKGFNQGLIVETLCGAVAGGNLGMEMGSFTDNDGKPIGNGQFFIALEPEIFSAGLFKTQIGKLITSIKNQTGARLPNARRKENRTRLETQGLPIDRSLYERLRNFSAT